MTKPVPEKFGDLPAVMREVEADYPTASYWIGKGKPDGRPITYGAVIFEGAFEIGVGENELDPAAALYEALNNARTGPRRRMPNEGVQ